MGRRLYVGNLPYSATEDQLTELFSRAGKVDNVRVMRDMATGRARGFALSRWGRTKKHRKRSPNSTSSRWRAGRWWSTKPVRNRKVGSVAVVAAVAAADIAAAVAVAAAGAWTTETSAAAGGRSRAGNFRAQGSGLRPQV